MWNLHFLIADLSPTNNLTFCGPPAKGAVLSLKYLIGKNMAFDGEWIAPIYRYVKICIWFLVKEMPCQKLIRSSGGRTSDLEESLDAIMKQTKQS